MRADQQPARPSPARQDIASFREPRAQALVHLEHNGTDLWVHFEEPVDWLETNDLDRVAELLVRVEQSARDGLFAVGSVAYEAAPAFDHALRVFNDDPSHRGGGDVEYDATSPLLAFALFRRATVVSDPIPPFSAPARPRVRADELVEASTYRDAIKAIRSHIAEGDVYQVNYTFPLSVSAQPQNGEDLGDQLFRQLCRSQGGAFACRLTAPGLDLASGTPELFFERAGHQITCRPMKGTAPRGRFLEEDQQLAATLRASPKERAENLMIVDMMRNDLGRIARSGSVTVERLFEVERLPTLHQMTSTVTAHTSASLLEVFRALFPCASITGAPKSSAMRIIAELERAPRGIYTGALGVVLPASPKALGWAGGDLPDEKGTPRPGDPPYARFGVAIRTAWRAGPDRDGRIDIEGTTSRDGAEATYRYGIGSGVVWDSRAGAELAETRSKALGLGLERPPFELLETMALRPLHTSNPRAPLGRLRLWPQHRQRLLDSARYFDFRAEIGAIEDQLAALCLEAPPPPQRLRLLLAVDGTTKFEIEPFPRQARRPWRLGLCSRPVDTDDPFLFHKTTRRALYTERLEAVRTRLPDADDALLQNEHGELTESTVANLLLPPERTGEPWRTPPRTAGLLAGTLRAELLRRGRIIEADLTVEDLEEAQRILLINSVRGVFPATLIDEMDPEPETPAP